MKVKPIAAMLALLVLGLGLGACGNHQAKPKAPAATWTRMARASIQTQDSAKLIDAVSGQTAVDTMEGLYRYDGKHLKPGLAKSVVKATDNGLTYTFHLRDSQWENGQPVVAADFVYAWRRAVTPATKAEYASLYSGIAHADEIRAGKLAPETLGVKALDAQTLQVTLEHAMPYFNTMMVNPAFFPINRDAVAKYGDRYGTDSRYLVTNGPYLLKGWHGADTTWTEVKNPRYWRAQAVHIKTIKTRVVRDSATALSLYQAGKLDDAVLTGNLAQTQRHNPDYQRLTQGRVGYLNLNIARVPAFRNKQLRQALSLAIDRQQFVDKVLRDGSLVAQTLTPQGIANNPDTGVDFAVEAAKATKPYATYDFAQAKQLWQSGLKAVGQSQLSIELLADDTEQAKLSAVYLQSVLERLPGLKIKLKTVSFKTRVDRALAGNTQMVLSSWQGDYPDPMSFLSMYTTGNTYNFSEWQNADYDALIAAAKTDEGRQRYADLQQAQQLLAVEMPVVPLYQTVEAHLRKRTISGLTNSPANMDNFVDARLTE